MSTESRTRFGQLKRGVLKRTDPDVTTDFRLELTNQVRSRLCVPGAHPAEKILE